MNPNLPVERNGRTYARARSVKLRSKQAEFADATGRTYGSAGQRLHGNERLNDDNVAYLRICKARGDQEAIDAHMRPQLAIANDVEPEPLTDALVIEATRTNGREQTECCEFLATRSDKDLDDLIRESAHDAAVSYRLYDAAIAERHRRRGAK